MTRVVVLAALLAGAPARGAGLDVSGYWETPDLNVIQLVQNGGTVTGVYVELQDDWKAEYEFSVGGPALSGTVQGNKLTGEMQIHFPKSKRPKGCEKPPATTAKFDATVTIDGQCSGLTGKIEHQVLQADCTVKAEDKDDDLKLVYLRGGTSTARCPRVLVKILGADLDRSSPSRLLGNQGNLCRIGIRTDALAGTYSPASPGSAPDDGDDRRLEDYYRGLPEFKGMAPPAYLGNACWRSLLDESDFSDPTRYPLCSDGHYLPMLAAEYYSDVKRLSDAIAASLQSIAALDKLLGANCGGPSQGLPTGHSTTAALLPGVSCDGVPDLGPARATCAALQSSCSQDVDYLPLIADLVALEEQDLALKALIDAYPMNPEPWPKPYESDRDATRRFKAHRDRYSNLLSLWIALEGNASPWFSGDFRKGFRQARESAGVSIGPETESWKILAPRFACEGLKEHARALRAPLVERLGLFTTALRCISQRKDDCDESAFREALDNAPPIPDLYAGRSGAQVGIAAKYLADVDCRKDLWHTKDELYKTFWKAAGIAAITAVTLGVGSWAAAAGGALDAATTTAEATSALSTVRLAAAISLALDVGVTVATLREDLHQCSNAFYQLGGVQPPAPASSCPLGAADPGAQVMHDYLTCSVESFGKAALFLLPAAGSLSQLRNANAAMARIAEAAAARAEAQRLASLGRRLPQVIEKFCFGPGTPIETPEGPQPIESLREGDLVLARDESTGQIGPRRVSAVSRRVAPEVLIWTIDAEQIRITPDHPVYLADHRLLAAKDVSAGARLLTRDGTAVLESVRRVAGEEAVYNLEVESAHTYFAGGAAIQVHNGICKDVELQAIRQLLDGAPRQLQKAFADGKIGVKDLAELIDNFDAALYQAARNNGVVSDALMRELNGQMKSLDLGTDVERALQRQFEQRLYANRAATSMSNKMSFLGKDLDSLGTDFDGFLSTTESMRNQVAGRQFRDPFTNMPANPTGPMEADHIFPVSEIKKLPGFKQLSKADQMKVVYNMDNIQPLPKYLNASKSDLLAKDWQNARIAGGQEPLSTSYVQWLEQQQEAMRKALQAQITGLRTRPH